MTETLEEAGCPIRDDHWPRWLKMRDGAVIWFDSVVSWDGEWIEVRDTPDCGMPGLQAGTLVPTVRRWIDSDMPLRATSIRWSEVVAHGELES